MNKNSYNKRIILETKKLTKNFGKFSALFEVDLAIREKEITSLIGPNGAGKTTFFNAISGALRPTYGHVFFKGKDISGFPPHKIIKLGLARSFQVSNIFSELTVFENIRSAVTARSIARMNMFKHIDSYNSLYAESMQFLKLVGLEDKKDFPCPTLSHGDVRAVEIGITLATQPDLIFLDEPTAGMTPQETMGMVDLIKNLSRQTKTTIFVIEHDMKVVFSISNRIIVLHHGQILADGTPEQIRENSKVKEAYLGGLTDAGDR